MILTSDTVKNLKGKFMKYHSEPLVPHKSALMQMPANLLAEDVCLPAAIIKKQALENNITWMQRYR